MEMIRKLTQCLVQEKRGTSSLKKATAKGKGSKIKSLAGPTLVDQRRRSCSFSDVTAKREQERKEQQKQSHEEQHSETEVRPCPVAVTSKKTASTMKNRVLT